MVLTVAAPTKLSITVTFQKSHSIFSSSISNVTCSGEKADAKSGEEGEEDEPIDPAKLSEIKMQVQNAQVEEPKIVEEARNKQKEKRNEALEKDRGQPY